MFKTVLGTSLLTLTVLVAPLSAQNKKKQAVTKPEKADADFQVQGEYSGQITTDDGKEKLGVQVVARGDGKFHAVAYPGGLPGDGWNGEDKLEAEGQIQNGVTTLKGEKGTGTIQDGTLTIRNKDGQEIGELEKITRKSPTLGKKSPKGAVVLFPKKVDLSNVSVGKDEHLVAGKFKGGRITMDGLLKQGATSKQKFQSHKLHVEFRLPYMPYARGQGRANSGCYLQGRYEVQILDSFGLEGKHNECGGIYEIRDPNVNMCFPPLTWQTYDIDFTAAKYDDQGNKLENARMTVRHNGVVVHKNVEVPRSTRAAPVNEGPEPGPVYLQNHGNPVRFRNIWLAEKDDAEE